MSYHKTNKQTYTQNKTKQANETKQNKTKQTKTTPVTSQPNP